MHCTEGVERIKILNLAGVCLMQVQGLALQLVGHQQVVDDIVLHQGVLGVRGRYNRVEGHVIHLSVYILLLIPGSSEKYIQILCVNFCMRIILENLTLYKKTAVFILY